MASKPGEYIDWVSDDGASKLTSQNASEQNLGFVSNTPASPTIMNWILNKISKWLKFLDELELNQVSDSTDYKKVKTESLTSNEVDHTKILNKGSNSHSTIDSHIGASAAHGVSGDVVGTSDDQELTTKTIDADSNTISNLEHGNEVDNPSSGVHGVSGDVVGTSDDQELTTKTIDADSNTISNLEHGNEVDNPTTAHGTSSAIVGIDDTQTLTQKTLTSPKINEDVVLASTSSEIDAAVENANIYTGTLWTLGASSTSKTWTNVTYGNGLFVAIGGPAGTDCVMTSSDGISWTTRTTPSVTTSWYGIAYGNGLFVAVGVDAAGSCVMTSPDGISWTSRTPSANLNWLAVTYGNSLFVAVANDAAGNTVMTSSDGITWTGRTPSANSYWNDIIYEESLFVVCAGSSGTTNHVMTSANGISWTSRTTVDNVYSAIGYGNGTFVIVGQNGKVETSPDGITWTARSAATTDDWRGIAYGNEMFVATGDGAQQGIMTSPDGITWSERFTPSSNTWWKIIYQNGIFITTASAASGIEVMTSGKYSS